MTGQGEREWTALKADAASSDGVTVDSYDTSGIAPPYLKEDHYVDIPNNPEATRLVNALIKLFKSSADTMIPLL